MDAVGDRGPRHLTVVLVGVFRVVDEDEIGAESADDLLDPVDEPLDRRKEGVGVPSPVDPARA